MARTQLSLLLVEHPVEESRSLAAWLRQHDFEVVCVRDGESALNALDKQRMDAVVCDLNAPRIDGLAVLAHALARRADTCVVLLTEGREVERAVEAVRLGAWDVLSRPVQQDRLLAALRRGRDHQALTARVEQMSGELDRRHGIDALVGRSRAIERVRDQVRQIAPTRAGVLLVGEEGTGRSVAARAIHRASPRRDERFVWLDAAELPAALVEADLFGTAGAAGARRGRVELADGGTLFVDNLERLPAAAQLRLLRVMQDRVLERVGGDTPIRVDVRVLGATTRDPLQEVRAGRLREDLFYRLDVVRITMPPLRERREDLPALVEHLLRQLAREHGRRSRTLTRGAMERVRAYDWPGNVSELVRVLEGLVVSAAGRGPIDVSSLPEPLREAAEPAARLDVAVGMTLDEVERQLIENTLRHAGGNKMRAAAMLGIGLRTLYRKIERYRLG